MIFIPWELLGHVPHLVNVKLLREESRVGLVVPLKDADAGSHYPSSV